MLDSIQLTEFFLQCKRDDIERLAQHQKLHADIDGPRGGFCPRQAVAGALMRIAIVIDERAARAHASKELESHVAFPIGEFDVATERRTVR